MNNFFPKLELNEDFFNPFDVEEEKEKKPVHLADKGGMFIKKKETFNLARIEYSKKQDGNFNVQAKTQFAKGEIVEICPVLILGEEAKIVDKLKDIIFEIDKDKNEWGLVLGYGSLYGHSDNPNIEYAFNKLTRQMYFITKQSIKLGEELTINYGKDYWTERTNINTMATTTPVKNESEVQPNAADNQNDANIKSISNPKNPANPVVSGIAITGGLG